MTDNKNSKYYLPLCKENPCNGFLKLKFNINNFYFDYECSKNSSHKEKNIFFKTFERFYLKGKEFQKCSKCFSSLENDCIYKCQKCNEIYCSNCFTLDNHIKKDIKSLIQLSKKM